MDQTVAVTAIALETALGDLIATGQGLQAGRRGIKFFPGLAGCDGFPLALRKDSPQRLTDLLRDLIPGILPTVQQGDSPAPWGVVVGSSRGNQGRWEQWVNGVISPDEWLATLPDQAAREVARALPNVGGVWSPMAACGTGLWAIAQGADLIRRGEYERVVVGAVETPITPLTLAGFDRMGALAPEGCWPFDRRRQGLVLGEGGALLVLENKTVAQRRGARIYGEILGAGFTCDAYDRSAPAPDNHSARQAIAHGLRQAQLTPDQISFIHPHGTGTRLNDQREGALIQSLFPPAIPVTPSKGATGHTLGASGAIAVALSLWTLHHQRFFPCAGLREPDFSLCFPGVTSGLDPSHPLTTALCLSFGFGGFNGALVLGRGD